MNSKSGSQLELLPYLQPTLHTLHSSLKLAVQENPEPGLEHQLKNLDDMLKMSLQTIPISQTRE